MEKTLKQYALDCVSMGFAVFPLTPRGKKPLKGSHGCKDATRNVEQVEAWWRQNPDYNVGIACGAVSDGLVVIDLDVGAEKNGVERLNKWSRTEKTEIPETATVKTGNGGIHLYFRDITRPYPNRGNLFKDNSGVDVRGDGGYVVAPGSIHPNGKRYEWAKMPLLTGIQQMPAALKEIIINQPQGGAASATRGEYTEEIIQEGGRTDALFRELCRLQGIGWSDEEIRMNIHQMNMRQCNPPLTDDELEREVFPALKRYEKGNTLNEISAGYSADVTALVERLHEMRPEQNKRYDWNDKGNGNLFSDLCRGAACYAPERDKWYFYDGGRWAEDKRNCRIKEYCKTIADALMLYCTRYIDDEKLRGDYMKHVMKWQQYRYRETILKDASSVAPVYISEFDRDPFLLNCENGTLDLKSGEFREHNSSDMITKMAGVRYEPAVRCERWERFISEVTCGDAALATYIQKALGYSLTGDTGYECFFILYGATSRNGKSTLCETFMHLMGDYGRSANAETVAKRKYSDSRSPTEDVARLAGARFVQMGEPDKSMIFNAALLKTLTGNDTISARFLGENSFEFRPQFKMFLNTNHLPYVSDVTLFSSDRVNVIPFKHHFSESERDPALKGELAKPENQSGILNWCLQGLRAQRAEGWALPDAVREATQEYRETSDKIGQFISDKLERDPAGECDARSVHGAYQSWCIDSGLRAESFGEFKKSLETAGIAIVRGRLKGADRKSNKSQIIKGFILQNQ